MQKVFKTSGNRNNASDLSNILSQGHSQIKPYEITVEQRNEKSLHQWRL